MSFTATQSAIESAKTMADLVALVDPMVAEMIGSRGGGTGPGEVCTKQRNTKICRCSCTRCLWEGRRWAIQ